MNTRSAGWALALPVALATPAFAVAAGDASARGPLDPDLINSAVTVIVFLALLAVLYRFAWGPIQQGLKAREDAQFKALDDARKAQEEAAALRAGLQADMAKAQDQVRAIMDEARRDAEALRTREREAGQKEAASERERATREIAVAKVNALQEISQRSVQLAALMASKALRRQTTVEDQERLVDESLAELKAGAGRG